MSNLRPTRLRRTAVATAAFAATLAAAIPASAEQIIGLTTTNALLSFDSATPINGSTLSNITGLQVANERILSIDLRPTTGLLYGVSSEDRVYSLSSTGMATFVGALTTPLASDVVGLDFNPAADLAGTTSLRIISSTGQNYAFNVTTGASAAGVMPAPAGFSSVAYSNNDLNAATGTTLFAIDAANNTLQSATNFNAPNFTTVGSLGFDANGVNGFDISGSGVAFAAMTDADTGKSGLYTINLGTGAATFAGSFGIGGNTAIAPPLLGLTVAAIPEPGTYALLLAGLAGVGFVARRRTQA